MHNGFGVCQQTALLKCLRHRHTELRLSPEACWVLGSFAQILLLQETTAQVRELKFREVKEPAQGHTAGG